MIKPFDRGVRVIILDFREYTRVCKGHLESEQKDDKGYFNRYYIEVDDKGLLEAKQKIPLLLEEHHYRRRF